MKATYIRPEIKMQAIETVMPLATSNQAKEEGNAAAAGGVETTDPTDPYSTYTQLSKQNNGWDDSLDDSSDDSNSIW